MRFQGTEVILTKAEAKALVQHSSKDETRPHVNAVLFSSAEYRAVATDGHRLLIGSPREKPAGDGLQVLVPRSALERMIKMAGGKSHQIRIDLATPKAVIVDTSRVPEVAVASVDFAPVSAQFPPYEQVVPKLPVRTAEVGFHLNADYLADSALVTAATENRTSGLTVYAPAGPLDPILLATSGAESEWRLVIMPMRTDDNVDTAVITRERNSALVKGEKALAIEEELLCTLKATRQLADDLRQGKAQAA